MQYFEYLHYMRIYTVITDSTRMYIMVNITVMGITSFSTVLLIFTDR